MALSQELRVAGALGRVEAVTGAPVRALERQTMVTRIQRETYAWQEMSRPLAEWLRLAGACGVLESFERAEEMFREADAYRAIDTDGRAYVALSWARGAIMLSVERGDEVPNTLDRLANDSVVPDHVQWSARRWLAKHYAQVGDTTAAGEQVRILEEASAPDARIACLLMRLDGCTASLGSGSLGLVQELRALQEGVVRHLLKASPPGGEADYVTQFYPY
jgi:hypothetical protein